MNPVNFSNVGGGMPGMNKPPGQMQVPQKNENAQMILKHVAQALQSQGPFTGWRAEVPIQERAMKVYQMISSLRLIQPRIELQNAVQAALSFEEKAFRDAREKVDYEKECTDKLVHIRDTRARQAAVMQGGMMQQAGAGAGMAGVRQNMMQPPFAPQMNRPMQASPMQIQQQMAMGMNDPNQQAAMQQQRQQQSQQAFMQQHAAQQRQGTGVPLRDDLNMLSPQEFEQVCRLANQMLLKTSPEDMEKIKMNLQNMTQEQRQYLARKNIEPMTYFFRSQALRELRRHKRNRMEMAARAQNGGVDPNGGMMGDQMMNPQQRQMVQNMIGLQRNSAIPMNTQQNLDPASFIGNVENIQGQQADGLRSQEAGQLVVPASSSQMNPQQFAGPQGMFPGGQQLGQNGQPNANRAMNPHFLAQQQHLQNAQSVQQERIQQAAQFQAQSQAQSQAQAHARAQAAQKVQMAMSSQAGQANSQISQTLAQQSPAMPMLNRPVGPQISPVQVGAQARPQSRAPGMGQQAPGIQSIPGQPGMQNRPQIPPGLPPALQEQLSQMTPEQINAFLMNQRRNQAVARANAAQQSLAMQQNLSHTGQTPQMPNGQISNDPNMRATMGLQQQLSGMGAAQSQLLTGQQMSLQQRQQQQNELQKMQYFRSQNGGMDMTPEQIREMDRWQFPPSIINSNNMNSPVPKNVKTWGQLKQWAAQNPHLLGGVDLPKLLTLQRLHLAQTLSQGRDANRNAEQGTQAHGVPMTNFQGHQQPFMAPQNFQPGQQQQAAFNMAAAASMRPITANDILMARQRLGAQAQNYTDEQLRELLHRNRQKHIMQAQNRAAAQAFAQQALNQGQPAQQPQQQQQAPAPQTTPQMKKQQPVPQQTPQANAKSQATAAGKNVKVSPAKAASKKRPSSDEVTEVPPPKAQPVSQAPTAQVTAATARPNITREQLAAMTPQQRAQLEAHMRRQTRAPITKAAAEEAWSHLPEKLRHLYGEISKNAPAPEPVNVLPEQKAIMAQQLRDCTDMLGRMDTLVQWFAKIPGQEKNVRSLLGMRIQLMRQFKDPDWTLNDQFNISPESLAGSITYIKKLFAAMITRVHSQQQNQPGAQRPTGQPAAAAAAAATTTAQQTAQAKMPQLNASNLQQLQQQEEALQRAKRTSNQNAPPAPTAPQPPFALGAPSPQGVPQAYGPGGLTPDKLKLPPSKKRKQSHGTTPSTPAQGQAVAAAMSKAQAAKQMATDVSKAALVGQFKCAEAECEYHQKGFATQAALDKHVEENHKVEHIGNPLEFALESYAVLVKDKEKTGAQESKVPTGTIDMQRAASKPGVVGPLKAEGATPVTAGTTPMGRVPSQIGPKSTSPASNQLQTPRTVSGKGPAPPVGRPIGGKEERKEAGKTLAQISSPEDVMTKDPWTDSTPSLEAIHDTFMDFGDDNLHGLGFDPLEEFLNSEVFGKTQAEDTPDSVETAAVTQTPKDGEASKEVDVKIGGVNDDNWIPSDWINLPGHIDGELDLLMNDRWEDLNWDNIEQKEADISFDSGPMDIYTI